ncbi:hypothetical protein Tco_0687900 [Tanacetum coccineum]
MEGARVMTRGFGDLVAKLGDKVVMEVLVRCWSNGDVVPTSVPVIWFPFTNPNSDEAQTSEHGCVARLLGNVNCVTNRMELETYAFEAYHRYQTLVDVHMEEPSTVYLLPLTHSSLLTSPLQLKYYSILIFQSLNSPGLSTGSFVAATIGEDTASMFSQTNRSGLWSYVSGLPAYLLSKIDQPAGLVWLFFSIEKELVVCASHLLLGSAGRHGILV